MILDLDRNSGLTALRAQVPAELVQNVRGPSVRGILILFLPLLAWTRPQVIMIVARVSLARQVLVAPHLVLIVSLDAIIPSSTATALTALLARTV